MKDVSKSECKSYEQNHRSDSSYFEKFNHSSLPLYSKYIFEGKFLYEQCKEHLQKKYFISDYCNMPTTCDRSLINNQINKVTHDCNQRYPYNKGTLNCFHLMKCYEKRHSFEKYLTNAPFISQNILFNS